jgi:hypothetical protein
VAGVAQAALLGDIREFPVAFVAVEAALRRRRGGFPEFAACEEVDVDSVVVEAEQGQAAADPTM